MGGCSGTDFGACTDISVGNDGGSVGVTVMEEITTGGSTGTGSDSSGGDWTSDASGDLERPEILLVDPVTGEARKPFYRAPRPGNPAPPPATLPTVIRASDVAKVAPSPGTVTTEPAGWAVMNTPMNAYVTAKTHTVASTINSVPVTVTFTPERYEWKWGDGTVTETEVPGDSWANLGLPNWSHTATSHSYGTRGNLTLNVHVHYSATVSAQGKTIPVKGLVTSPATSTPILVVRSDAALVANNCIDAPNDPGC